MSGLESDALLLRGLGFSVFPIRPKGKRPAVKWEPYQEGAAAEAVVREWWRSNPRFNVGIACGPVSDLLVVDVDGDLGAATLAELETAHGGLPATWRVRTGKGEHVYFHYPKGRDLGNSRGLLKHRGIDIRGHGGYVVGPGSIHESGRAYDWIDGCDPLSVDCAECPGWLLDQIDPPAAARAAAVSARPKEAYVARAFDAEVSAVVRAPSGSRNETLNTAAYNLGTLIGAGLLDEAEVKSALGGAAAASGLDAAEIAATLASGLAAGIAQPREIADRGNGLDHGPPVSLPAVADLPPWEPPGETEPAGPRFVLQPFDSIRAPMEPYYLVKDILPRRGLAVIWGPPKCGKSFWILDLALHVALGWGYRGRKVRDGAVVYIACEGGSQFGARIEAFRQEKMAEGDSEVQFWLIAGSLDLIGEHKRLAIEIAAVCPAPALIVIDTVNRSLDGSEVDDMPAYIRGADFLSASLGCVVAVVHHCGVAGERPRGHTSLTGNADAQIAVKKSETGLVSATVEFMKDGMADTVLTSRIRMVNLGTDTDGEPRDSCIVEPAEDPVPASARGRVGGNQSTALAILGDAMPAGLTVEDWNERLRDAGIGKSRTATLVEIRLALKAKKLVHEYAGRWYVTPA